MKIEFDDKGKFFTDIIQKNEVEAVIMTSTHKILGHIHVRQDQRIKDELDADEKFVAVTDAKLFSLNGEIDYHCEFIAVQRSQIIWVIPSPKA